jgi:hypothetical protein
MTTIGLERTHGAASPRRQRAMGAEQYFGEGGAVKINGCKRQIFAAAELA